MALPKDPRQLMINLMYLVLTAMLALNITKEVLTAFQTINTSIEGSVKSIDGKNANFYQQFEDLYKQPDKKSKVEPFRAKALLIKAQADKMMTYLANFKDTVIARSGGYEEGSNGKKELKGLDNIDVSTSLFVEQKKGEDLRNKMNAFKAFLLQQVDEKTKTTMSNNIPIQLADLPVSDENPKGDWAFGTFHNIPVVATIAMLSKFQNDVKNSESLVLEHLLSQVGKTDWKFDQVKAIATPKTSYALEGQEIEATIILAAYNSTMVTNMGPGVSVDQGVGTMKFKATGVGQQTKRGTIIVPKDGEMKSYDYEFNYMVGTAGGSLQLDQMNVMYIGVDNPITLSASGYNIEDVSLAMPGATLTAGTKKGTYIANVTKEGKIQYNINAKSRTGGATSSIKGGEIRVKRIPDPVAKVGNKTGGLISTGSAKAQLGIIAVLDNFDFNAIFKVTSFTYTYWPKIGDPVQLQIVGNAFNTNEMMRTLMQRSKAGDRWVFENVKAIGPDKTPRSLNSIVLTLN